MYEKMHVVIGLTDDIEIIKREVTNGRDMVVNSGRIIAIDCGIFEVIPLCSLQL